ncbi:unnamed protein product, partial [Vitis vinifera]
MFDFLVLDTTKNEMLNRKGKSLYRDTIGDPEQKLPDIVLLRYINPSTASGAEHPCRWKLSWQELFCQGHPFPRWPPLLFPLLPLTAFPYSFHIIFHPHNIGFFNSEKPLLFPGHHLIGVPFRSSCNTGRAPRFISSQIFHAVPPFINQNLLDLTDTPIELIHKP